MNLQKCTAKKAYGSAGTVQRSIVTFWRGVKGDVCRVILAGKAISQAPKQRVCLPRSYLTTESEESTCMVL